jgi:CHAT domain-containing protein
MPDGALAAVERALKLSDAVRSQTANPELRAQLQAPLRAAYELKIELLRARFDDTSAAGRAAEAQTLAAAAFATADASRARSLADIAAPAYPAALRHTLGSEFQRREQLYRELSGRRFALEQRLDRFGSSDPGARHLMADIAELQRQVDTVNTAIAARTAPKVQGAGTGTGASSLKVPADTALISYWLGSESAYAWVAVPAGIQWQRLAPPAVIRDRAIAFHQSLTRLVDLPIGRRLEDGRALYEMVLQPVEPWLRNVRQWVVIPDGELDYVPFAALRISDTGDSFVVAHHDVALTLAAWMLTTREAPASAPHRRELLLVADPVYQADDPRLPQGARDFGARPPSRRDPLDRGRRDYQRLPFTAEEAAGIMAQFPAAEVDQLIGLDATRERLLSLDLSRYRFIHIATHGFVDAQVPQLSALLLGSYDGAGNSVDGAVRVADLSLQTLAADVAVFSACETALGRAVPSEGMLGIGSTVLARGARSVVASLWPVSDEIGARLMTDFYQHLLRDAMSPPAALGAAMRSVVSRGESADPALWAAFQVSVVALGPGLPGRNPTPENTASTTRP